ncbi:MAG: mitochondrial fission ELM1 family protein [Alphaproteobacteria bacterium]|nr:mitochondrial fission ELM1 family protein [Alphaproteobacteria bacterium]
MSGKNFFSTVWIITEGIAGTENQALAVADRLGVTPVVKRIGLHWPWSWFTPYLRFEKGWSFKPALMPPWPDLLITSGRKAVAASRYIKRASGGRTFTLHLQDPRTAARHFDLVAIPAHDKKRGENTIVTLGAPTRTTHSGLAQARQDFLQFETLKSPRVAVLIGGNSRAHRLTQPILEKLGKQLMALDAGLMITCSRRTGKEKQNYLKNILKGADMLFWDGEGRNPYLGMLAWADYIIVTNDSVSMLCDAAATGKPVYMVKLDGGGRRLNLFHENLIKAGIARVFEGRLESWTYQPLDDAGKVAGRLKSVTKSLQESV